MLRRDFFYSLTLLGAAFGINKLPQPHDDVLAQKDTTLAQAQAQTPLQKPALLLQTCAVAGFQYHHGEDVWNSLSPKQPLTLVREPNNPHDERAVRVLGNGANFAFDWKQNEAIVLSFEAR